MTYNWKHFANGCLVVAVVVQLKVVDIFTPAANLTKMIKQGATKVEPAVSNVFHKAKILVDERGAVAAGVSGWSFPPTVPSAPPSKGDGYSCLTHVYSCGLTLVTCMGSASSETWQVIEKHSSAGTEIRTRHKGSFILHVIRKSEGVIQPRDHVPMFYIFENYDYMRGAGEGGHGNGITIGIYG